MKATALIACILAGVGAADAQPGIDAGPAHRPSPVLEPLAEIIRRAAGADIAYLSMLPASGDALHPLRWIVWSEGNPPRSATRLALGEATQRTMSLLWSITVPDAYAPAIQLITPWRYGNAPVLAMTYQFGAEAAEARLYGISNGNIPVLVGSIEGAMIELRMHRGQYVVVAHEPLNVEPPRTCYGWNPGRRELDGVDCPD